MSPRSPSFPLIGASLNREIAAAVAELQFPAISYAYYKRGLQFWCNLAEINIPPRRYMAPSVLPYKTERGQVDVHLKTALSKHLRGLSANVGQGSASRL